MLLPRVLLQGKAFANYNFNIEKNMIFLLRLACHSCSPNTEVVAWKVQGLDCLAMYSIKNIRTNESVTFNHTPQIQVIGYEVILIVLNAR